MQCPAVILGLPILLLPLIAREKGGRGEKKFKKKNRQKKGQHKDKRKQEHSFKGVVVVMVIRVGRW